MPPSALDLSSLLQGEFTLEEKLGGQVYRARRRRDGRDLAVRIVRPASPLLAAEFISLAESASRVKHPTLANVEEFGRMGDEACYIASEFVKGQKLDEWADTVGIPPLAQVIELVRRLCIGLQAAARSGVAHDALNPRNLRVMGATKGSGTRTPIKLLDIGVPALVYDHARDPKAVRFMAPEQLQVLMRPQLPETFRCSETMNVYSCGALLYYLATGGPPHPGSAPSELLASQAAGRLAPPIRINPQISPSLNAVVLRALAIDPSERYASVAELGEALANVALSVPMYSLRPAPPAAAGRNSVPSLPAANSQIEPPAAPAKPVTWDDDPPTFKTSRIAELEAARLEESVRTEPPPRPPSGPLEDDKPTVPPPAASAPAGQVVLLESRDSISGVAPIGLFSSAPPVEDAFRSSFPPASAAGTQRGAPLAAFSTAPPPAADGGGRSSSPPAQRNSSPRVASGQFPRGSTPPELQQPAAAGEVAARAALDPGRISEPPRRRAQRSSALKIALPLAAGACLAAFFTVRSLLAPEPEPGSAADGGGRVNIAAEPHAVPPLETAPAPAPTPAPHASAPAAIAPEAPAPAQPEVASPLNELIPDGNAANAPRGRDWKEWRDNRDYRERAHRSRHASSNDGAKEAKDDSPKLDESLRQPPVPEANDSEPEPPVARAKPASPPPAEAVMAPAPARVAPANPESSLRIALVPDRPAPPPLPLQAKAQIGQVTVRGSLPTSLVRRAVERIRSQFETCYTRAAQGAGHNGFGELIVDVQIDERGRAREPHAHGGALPHLDACVAEAAAKIISEKAPDTGTVTASWKVAFSP